MNESPQSLTKYETALLAELERRISDHGTHIGQALMEIRDKRLYRSEFSTFEEYTTTRWGYQRAHASRMIAFHEVKMSPIGRQILNERQAREIVKVPEERREEVMAEVARDDAPVTAQRIRMAARTIIDVEDVSERKDQVGRVIPQELVALFDRTPEVNTLMQHISAVRSAVRAAQDASDVLYRPVNISRLDSLLAQIYADLRTAIPFAVCPYCQGVTRSACSVCKGRGAVSKYAWDNVVPQELKDICLKSTETARP